MFASQDDLENIIDEKAVKLCGKGKYKYESEGSLSNGTQTSYSQGVEIQARYNILTKIVNCQSS
jgi:hypothetical protein